MKMLKIGGSVLFVIGLTYTSWMASYIPTAEDGESLIGMQRVSVWWAAVGTRFGAGWLFMIIGAVMARKARKQELEEAAKADDDGVDGKDGNAATIDTIQEAVDALSVEGLPEGAQELADALDEILSIQVPSFLELRERMIAELGLERFAEMIGYFASMERALARSWSALTDEAFHEVIPSIERAKRFAKLAAKALETK